MNASTILAQHGYTLTQAAQWLSQNANNPREIYATTKALGLSNDMLADILRPSMPSISAAEIDAYFNGNGIATASSVLAQHGWTTAQAAQWIQAHLNDPAQIQSTMASLELDYTMLRAQWPHHLWINPVEERAWGHARSTTLIREIFEGRMVPMTLDGLAQGVRELR